MCVCVLVYKGSGSFLNLLKIFTVPEAKLFIGHHEFSEEMSKCQFFIQNSITSLNIIP